MAYANARFGYHPQQSDSALDNKRAAFIDDDDSAVLDPSILDADIMQSPNHHHNNPFRKQSFPNNNGVLSPADSHAWDHQYGASLSIEPTSAGASNPFHDEGNAFVRHGSQQGPGFVQHHHAPSWQFEHGSGNCTPTTGAEFMPPPPQFDPSYQRTDSAHGSFSQQQQPPPPAQHGPHFGVPHTDAGFIPAPQVQTPMSPHSHADWMGLAQQELDSHRSSHKRMRGESPSRTPVDFQRRDGIRKKNNRIDIPQERNIQNIDDMIEKTSDEELLKELKQQKRLLRNREAALASRQRKKKHTEDLEVKEKSYTSQISMLESKLNDLTNEREHREREWQMIHQRLAEAQRIMDTMQEEKRELIMRHNEEASSLRKKVQVLTEQLEAGPAPMMSAVPSSTGFTDFNAEMEALNMGPHDWDNFILVNDLQTDGHDDFNFDPKPEPVRQSNTLEKKSSSSTITQNPKKQQEPSSLEQPIASGLLFMLLLCGAFVASKPAGSQPSDLPKMPANVRAAAPAVLSNLLSEMSPTPSQEVAHSVVRMGQEPMPSGLPYTNLDKPSRLDRMHRAVMQPTKQQEHDQAFALTPAQYASMTNMDHQAYDQQPQPAIQGGPPRRNLAEALANLEHEHRNSKAEVYTRSLLWDQIPADVVRQFKEIVRDHNEIEQRQRRQSNDYAYKIEQ